jgi:hypothetical protein
LPAGFLQPRCSLGNQHQQPGYGFSESLIGGAAPESAIYNILESVAIPAYQDIVLYLYPVIPVGEAVKPAGFSTMFPQFTWNFFRNMHF